MGIYNNKEEPTEPKKAEVENATDEKKPTDGPVFESRAPDLTNPTDQLQPSPDLSVNEQGRIQGATPDEPLHTVEPVSAELAQEVAGDRKLVLAKTDRVYEVFLCDQCEQQVKSRNIYLCATCDYNFGLCEKCFLTGMRSKEKERELRLHQHALSCVPNTFYKPYNISLHNDLKYADDELTVQLLACHPLTHRIQMDRIVQDSPKEEFLLYFENHLYLGKITSTLVTLNTILDIIPALLKATNAATYSLIANRVK
jgi:hypothetical protein